jgi:triacylglycerol lipase
MLIGRASALIASTWLGLAVASGWGSGLAMADTTDSNAQSSESTETSDQEDSASTPEADPGPDPDGQEDEAPAEAEGESEAPEVDSDADDAESSERSNRSNRKKATANESLAAAETSAQRVETESDGDARPKAEAPATEATEVTAEESVAEPPPAAADTVVVATPIAVSEPVAPAPPASTVTRGIADVIASVLQPFSAAGDVPGVPVDTPAAWALLGFARREIGTEATVPEQDARVAAQQVSTSLTVDATTTAIPDNWEDQYTGQPSFVHQLVVVGLKIVDIVLKPFGGLLSFTSLKIPLFTDGIPPFFFRHGLNVERTDFEGMPVWTLEPKNPSGEYIVALHGGAYVAEASLFHWWTYTDMARDTGATVIVPLYRLVPDGGTAGEVVPKTARFLEKVMADHGAENVSVIGDSAGGGIALAAVQELVDRDSAVPSRLVLFAPWLDATMSDRLSTELDPGDPLLDVPNLREAGEDWGGDLGAGHRYASPLFGSLAGLPPTTVYSGSLDLLTPDTLRLQQLVAAGGYSNFTFNLRKDLIHDWVIFGFLPDAHAIRPSVYAALLGD